MDDRSHRPLHLTYVLLSPTFGMHQYTADLANRMAAAGHRVTLVTTRGYPEDRYAPEIHVCTPLQFATTGFSPEGANLRAFRRVLSAFFSPLAVRTDRAESSDGGDSALAERSSAVHFTGVHLWNLPLVWALRRRGVPVVHTLHDLDPHHGRRFGALIRLWNRLLIRSGCHLLVHGQRYRGRLLAQGVAAERVTYAPLLHLFLGYEAARAADPLAAEVHYEPWALFFGRLLPYKGVGDLLEAQARLGRRGRPAPPVTLAGPGDLARLWDGPLPAGVALRNHLIDDQEALDLFRRCGLLVLPYRDATQSALVAAAYSFRKPVIVTDVGALPEYVERGRTGWVVPPGDPAALADCLADALSDPERLATMGECGRAWYNEQRRTEWETLVRMVEGQASIATHDREPIARPERVPSSSRVDPEFIPRRPMVLMRNTRERSNSSPPSLRGAPATKQSPAPPTSQTHQQAQLPSSEVDGPSRGTGSRNRVKGPVPQDSAEAPGPGVLSGDASEDVRQTHGPRQDRPQPRRGSGQSPGEMAAAPSVEEEQLGEREHISPSGLRLRRSERRLLLMLVDLFLVNAGLVAALAIWAGFSVSARDLLLNSKWFVTLSLEWLLFASLFDCYDLARAASTWYSLRSSGPAALATVALYALTPWLTPSLESRGLLFTFGGAAVLGVMAWRAAYAQLFVQPWFKQRALLVGAGGAGRALVAALHQASNGAPNPFLGTGYRIVGFVDDDPRIQGAEFEDVPVLGDSGALLSLAEELDIDEVILAITHRHAIEDRLFDALLRCRELGYRVATMSVIYERLLGRVPVEHLGRDLHMVVPMEETSGERLYRAVKRLVDLVLAVCGLAATAIVAPFVALGNAVSCPGPLFYRQQRVGCGGETFQMLKFRTMIPNAERDGRAVWARASDERVTPAGRLLRGMRLDELPQCWNVLRGDMSIIGPRPERPEFVEELAERLPFYRARHAVRPGITGWAQIHFDYGSSVEDAKVKLEYDLYYVKHANLLLDLSILLQTIPVMLLMKGY